MEHFASIEFSLWVALLVAQGILFLRQFSEKLALVYPFFAVYLATEVISGLWLMRIPHHSRAYAEAFGIYAFVIVALRFGVAAELFHRIFSHFRRSHFPTLMAGGLVVVLALASLTTTCRVLHWAWPQTLAMVVRQFQGEIFGALFLSLWAILKYGMKVETFLRPNVLLHLNLCTVYFAVSGLNAFAILAAGGGAAVHPINTAMLTVDLGCTLMWLRLSAQGERQPWMPKFTDEEISTIQAHEDDIFGTLKSLSGEVTGIPRPH